MSIVMKDICIASIVQIRLEPRAPYKNTNHHACAHTCGQCVWGGGGGGECVGIHTYTHMSDAAEKIQTVVLHGEQGQLYGRTTDL